MRTWAVAQHCVCRCPFRVWTSVCSVLIGDFGTAFKAFYHNDIEYFERQIYISFSGVTFGQNATTAAPVEAKGLNRGNVKFCSYPYPYPYMSISISISIWVRSRNCGCLVTWFCYQLIAKPGSKAAAVSWPYPYPYPYLNNIYRIFDLFSTSVLARF